MEQKASESNKKQEFVLEFLRDEGYRPSLDDVGDIAFKKEGSWFFVILDDNDEQYYRILKPDFWSIDSPEELERACKVASKSSGGTKVSKVFLTEALDSVVAVSECFQPNVEAFTVVFDRMMSALLSVSNDFIYEMRRLRSEDETVEENNDNLPTKVPVQ